MMRQTGAIRSAAFAYLGGRYVENVLRLIGYGLCHQLPERSFFGAGWQVPVCARDTGIYVGFAVALIALQVVYRERRPSELPPWPVSSLLGLFVAVMAADGVTSYAGLRTTTNDVRLVTGLLAGFALAAFTTPLLNSQAWRRFDSDRLLQARYPLLVFLAAIPVTFVIVRYLAPAAGILYPLLVSVAILLTFTAVNLVIVCLLPWFERRASHWSELGGAAAIALVLTFGELALATSVRLWVERIVGTL